MQDDLDVLVRQAKRIRNVEIMFIPGLLQTPGYARSRSLEAVRNHGFAEDKVDAAVAARIRRQEVLYEEGRDFEFTIMETALLVRSCPPDVMQGQLDRLEIAAGLTGVRLGIIPVDAQLTLVPDMGFLVADDVAFIETPTSQDFLRGTEAATYDQIADGCRAESVTDDAARQLIMKASRRWRSLADGGTSEQ